MSNVTGASFTVTEKRVTMGISGDANIAAALDCSNIEASYRDHQRGVLEETLTKVNLPASDVLALSQAEVSLKPDGSSMGTRSMLLVVFKSGLAMADGKGLWGKRLDMQTASYKNVSAVVPDEKLYDRGRGEMAIQGMVGGSVPFFRIGWNWAQGGQTTAAEAAAERDRILNTIQRAIQRDWTGPSSRRAAPPDGSPTTVEHGAGGTPRRSTSAGRLDPAAEALPSKKEYLIDWTAGLFREAGIAPLKEHVEVVARTAAAGLFVSRVLAFADSRPLPALQLYCRGLPGDYSARFDQFDEIYATWIRLGTEADARTQDPSDPAYLRLRRQHIEMIDQAIDRCLKDSRASFIEGIRTDYGRPGGGAANAATSDEPPAEGRASPSGSAWETVAERARQAQQHVNPLALQHGIEAAQGALSGSGIAKIDKNTGRMKIKKVGVARAALQPTRTLRRALDGAALTEHLKAYNEGSQAMRGQLSGGAGAGRSIAPSSLAEFASYESKRDYLRDWARRLVVAAGVPSAESLIAEHANMAAAGIGFMVFLRLGAPWGISDLRQFFHPGLMPEGTPLETFDALYAKVIESQIGQQAADQGVVALLNRSWGDWIEGIRGQHG
ncbi:MAG TPA: hypothetical protein VIY52_25540 [Streptosporangiaceae bacterium]